MKTCTKCKETKALSEFGKDKRRKDGLNPRCKPCHREANATYRTSNRDKVREKDRKYYATNRDKRLEYNREYRANNRDKRLEYNREYRKANPEKDREAKRKWRAANPEKVKSYEHARRARKVNLYGGEPDHARITEWMQLTANDPCRWCGTTEFPDGYHWDHVVPVSIGGPHEWWNLVKACASCNLRKNAKLPEAVGFV